MDSNSKRLPVPASDPASGGLADMIPAGWTVWFSRAARRLGAPVAVVVGLVACAPVAPSAPSGVVDAAAQPARPPAPSPVGPQAGGPPGRTTIAPMLDRVTPAVVNIAVESRVATQANPLFRDPFFRHFFGNLPEAPTERRTVSAGSGVIVDAANGTVLTNHHVVKNATEITVTLKDRRSLEAELVGSDPATDIAVLKIDGDNLTQLPLANSGSLRVGDFVVAIGNPFGLGQTVTSGIVSALGRSGLTAEGFEDFIQTDASINPGNSGGALVTWNGELVGINSAIIAPAGGNVGIGFAVPSNMADTVMRQILRDGEVRRGRLGIVIQDLTPDIAEAMGLQAREGAVVATVERGSPAERAGLAVGDVVVEFNGQPVRGSSDLRNKVGLTRIGEDVRLTVVNNRARRTLTARVGGT